MRAQGFRKKPLLLWFTTNDRHYGNSLFHIISLSFLALTVSNDKEKRKSYCMKIPKKGLKRLL